MFYEQEFFQRTGVWFPVPILGSLQLPVTPRAERHRLLVSQVTKGNALTLTERKSYILSVD